MRLSLSFSFPNLYRLLKRVAIALIFITILLELGIACLEVGGFAGIWLSQQGWEVSIMLHLFFPILGLLIALLPYMIIYYVLPNRQKTGGGQVSTSISLDTTGSSIDTQSTPNKTVPLDENPLPEDDKTVSLDENLPSEADGRQVFSDQDTFASTLLMDKIPSSVLTESIHKEVAPSNNKLYKGPFVVPKEGNNPVRGEDRCATNTKLHRYAVTDGVSRAFLSDKWAEIIAEQFVIDPTITTNVESFASRLQESSDKWQRWATQNWIPEARDAGLGDNWDTPLRRGPETTLIACSLIFNPNNIITINAWAIGDAHFFLFRLPSPSQNVWRWEAFPYRSSADFGPTPETLRLRREMSKAYASYRYLKYSQYEAMAGDFVLLATDALARWIFLQLEEGTVQWQKLLKFTEKAEFTDFVVHERKEGMLEEDDTTMLVICLQSPSDTLREEIHR